PRSCRSRARPRPRLGPEFRLDLVEVLRELLVAPHVSAHEIRDDLLVRRPEVALLALAIGQPEERVAERVVAAGLTEVIAREEGREEHLLRAGAVHLLTDDVRELGEDPTAEREHLVDARPDHADESRAEKEDVRRGDGVLRDLPKGGDQG